MKQQMADIPAACKDGGSYGRPFLVSLCQDLLVLRNRISKEIILPPFCIFKVEKLLVVFVADWHIGEYNFVINNNILPKDTQKRQMKNTDVP